MRSWSLKSIKKIETMAFESSKEPKHTPRNPPHPEGHGQEPCLWIIISFGQRVVVLFALVPFKICDNAPFPFVQPKSEQCNSAEWQSVEGKSVFCAPGPYGWKTKHHRIHWPVNLFLVATKGWKVGCLFHMNRGLDFYQSMSCGLPGM